MGNPQNMLVGLSSGIPFVTFTLELAPVAISGLAVAWIVLVLVYREELTAEVLQDQRVHAVLFVKLTHPDHTW